MKNDLPARSTDEQIEQTIFSLLLQRDAAASICPSDVARALATGELAWRALMPEVRRVAAALAAKGSLRATRGEEEVHAMSPGGPIRLRRPK